MMTTVPSPDRVVAAPAERRATLLEVIRHARREILLSLFRCNDEVIFQELARATSRGVNVNVLVTSRARGSGAKLTKLWSALEQTGASVSAYDPTMKYHAKYLVADEGPAIVASLNLTHKCFAKTWDALVVTYDSGVVSGLQRLMAADRAGLPLPDDLSARLIIGPERARRQFTALIEPARSSVRLFDAKLSDPGLVALLEARRRAGVLVEIISANKLGGLRSHGKMLLIDDAIAVVGGLALSAVSLDSRREVAVVVNQPGAVQDVVRVFDAVRGAQDRASIAAAHAAREGAS